MARVEGNERPKEDGTGGPCAPLGSSGGPGVLDRALEIARGWVPRDRERQREKRRAKNQNHR